MSSNRSYPSRPGFNLIEFVVLVLILVVAAGILLAIINRKTGPKSSDGGCKVRLRDLSLAIWFSGTQAGHLPCNDGTNSVFYQILDKVDRSDVTAKFPKTSAVPPDVLVRNFKCGVDASKPGPVGAPASYVFNAAVFRGPKDKPLQWDKAMEQPGSTLLAGERLTTCGTTPFYTIWTDATPPELGTSVPACMFGVNNVGPDAEPLGSSPAAGMPVLANTNQANCLAPPANQWNAANVAGTAYFQSSHSNGVHFARGEGGIVTLPGNYDPLLVNLFCVPIKRDKWDSWGRYNTPVPDNR